MEIIRRNSDYALRGLSYIARYPQGRIFTIESLAKACGLPEAFLRKIFQRLSIKKILSSSAGPLGGFYLLKNPSQLSLRAVLEAVQGPISLNLCLPDGNFCHRQKLCKVRKRLSRVQKEFMALLNKTTLQDLS